MSEDFKNKGYILHPAKGKIPFFCNFATLEDLEGAISKLNTLTPKVVDELPSVGEPGVLYFVRVVDASGEDQSKEYIYIEEEGRFELVGTTGVDLSDVVTLSADQVIEGKKTFSSSPIVPSPNLDGEAANKSYVDAAVDSVPVFSPEEAQTISGAYNFTDGLTRTTKSAPAITDVMNKEMSDNAYVSKTGNSEVGGVKTFTEGITLADEAQLQLGTGTDAVKIHGMGAGKAVVEGTNVSELDFAVPVDLQETSKFEKLEKTIPDGTVDPVTFLTVKTADNEMGFTWDVDGSVSFGNAANAQPSWRVGTNGDLFIDSPLTANASATFNQSTFSNTINANGGVNIPMAVGAPTDTAAVNRLYAAGLSTVIEAFSPQSFLSNFNLYGGSVAVDQTVPGWFWKLRKTSADTGTVKVNLTNPFLGSGNYSGWCGFILPLMPGNFGSAGTFKFSFLIGGGGSGLVEKTVEPLDVFTRSPAARNTSPFLRFIDVTFFFGGDGTSTPGFPIRVRELMYDSGSSKWIVHESRSVFNFGNTNPSQSVFLTYQQSSHGNSAKAGLWIGSNGAAPQRLLCIADLHAVPDTYSFIGVSSIYWDCTGSNSYSHIGAMRQMVLPGRDSTNGAYDAFRALETRLIQSTSTYDFTPYE